MLVGYALVAAPLPENSVLPRLPYLTRYITGRPRQLGTLLQVLQGSLAVCLGRGVHA